MKKPVINSMIFSLVVTFILIPIIITVWFVNNLFKEKSSSIFFETIKMIYKNDAFELKISNQFFLILFSIAFCLFILYFLFTVAFRNKGK